MSREPRQQRFLAGISLALLICSLAYAQEESERVNSNMGAFASLPSSPTSNFVETSWGLVEARATIFPAITRSSANLCGARFIPPTGRFSRFGQPPKTTASPATATWTL